MQAMANQLNLANIPTAPGFNGSKKSYSLSPKVFAPNLHPENAQSIQILQLAMQIIGACVNASLAS